ncbi:MFS transporter [Flindersiella endophytica]
MWRNRDFAAYWVGQTASEFGTQVTFVALPLLAVLTLHASVGQVGMLRFAEYLPYLILTPLFGVWADRSRRRPLMLGSYAVRAILVFSIPALIALGLLRMPLLLVIVFVVGAGAALFEVCWLSYVPGLVPDDRLVDAMAKCATSQSAAEVSGPGIGGVLVQLVTAPVALLVDGVSYVIGVASLARTRYREPEPTVASTGRHVWRELYEGLRFAFGQPYIRPTVLMAAIGNFFLLVAETVFLVYAVRDLRLSAGLIGLILTATGAGGLLGAGLSHAATKRWPLGTVMVSTRIACAVGAVLLPVAAGPTVLVVAVCIASFFIVHGGMSTSNVLVSSLRQAVTPAHIRGRMNASCRTVVYGALPLGSLAGGILGETIGLHASLWLAAVGYATSIIPVLASPIPRLGGLPEHQRLET